MSGSVGCAAIQKDFNSWRNRVRNLLRFNKGKGKILHWGRNSSRCQYTLGAVQLESRLAEKVLRIPVDTRLDIKIKIYALSLYVKNQQYT